MLTNRLIKRGLSLLGTAAMTSSLLAGTAFAEGESYEQPVLDPHVKSIIEADGYQFIDLNGNGELDVLSLIHIYIVTIQTLYTRCREP